MAEQEPTISPALEKERKTLEEKRDAYERAQLLYNSAEAFGKGDVNVEPAEGEMTYQQYLEQRPVGGVVRDGKKVFRQEGKYASEASYEAQKVDTRDYYDEKGGLVNNAEYQQPNYENMGVMQLAKEAAKARDLADSAGEEEIKEALKTHLTIAALNDDKESSEEAQERYDKDYKRYEELVVKFLARPDVHAQHANDAHVEPSGEGRASQRVATTGAVAEAAVAGVVAPPEKAVTIVWPAELQRPAQEEPAVVEPTYEDIAEEKARVAALKVAQLYKQDPVEQKAIEQEKKEETKKWWQKAGDFLRPVAGAAAWATAWTAANYEAHVANPVRNKYTVWVNHGIEDGMTIEQVEEKRKRNRLAVIAAGAGIIAATALIGGYLAAKGLSSGSSGGGGGADAASSGIGLGEHNDWATQNPGMGHDLSSGGATEQVVNLPLDTGGLGGPESIPAAETSTALPELSADITPNEGGYELFGKVGLTPADWKTHAASLLESFPQDFFPMDDGGVGLLHPGDALSQGAQDAITAIKRGY